MACATSLRDPATDLPFGPEKTEAGGDSGHYQPSSLPETEAHMPKVRWAPPTSLEEHSDSYRVSPATCATTARRSPLGSAFGRRFAILLVALLALAVPTTGAQAAYETEVQAECVGWSSPGYLSFSVPGYVTFGARMRETLSYRIGYLWRDPVTGRRGKALSRTWHRYQVLSKYAGHMEGDTMIIGGQAIAGTSQVPFMRIPRSLWVHPIIQSWAPSTGYRIASWNPTTRGAFARLSGPYCRVV